MEACKSEAIVEKPEFRYTNTGNPRERVGQGNCDRQQMSVCTCTPKKTLALPLKRCSESQQFNHAIKGTHPIANKSTCSSWASCTSAPPRASCWIEGAGAGQEGGCRSPPARGSQSVSTLLLASWARDTGFKACWKHACRMLTRAACALALDSPCTNTCECNDEPAKISISRRQRIVAANCVQCRRRETEVHEDEEIVLCSKPHAASVRNKNPVGGLLACLQQAQVRWLHILGRITNTWEPRAQVGCVGSCGLFRSCEWPWIVGRENYSDLKRDTFG